MAFPRTLAHNLARFWYEGVVDHPYAVIPPLLQKRWYQADEALDKYLKENYEKDLTAFSHTASTQTEWMNEILKDPLWTVGTLVALDQCPRNIYRGTSKAFQFDPLAIALAKKAMQVTLPQIPLNQRGTLLLPFMHSELLDDQKTLLHHTQTWMNECKPYPELFKYAQNFEKFGIEHHDLIERFHRFPYRNKILNRTSTPEELEFLSTNATNYGQKSSDEK